MPDEDIEPALRAALRWNEIGTGSPYRLYFAGKGKSGASFGFMQGDMAAGQAVVQRTFQAALADAGVPAGAISSLDKRLSVPLIADPLSPGERDMVNAALLAGRGRVDAMDEAILQDVYGALDACVAAAAGAGSVIASSGLIYIALWVNMAGKPTKLLTWLRGTDPGLARPMPQPPGRLFDGGAMEAYLRATSYFLENPENFPHTHEAAMAGLALLPPAGGPARAFDPAAAPGGTADAQAAPRTLPGSHFLYEQANGRMHLVENGAHDLVATGYSGSELQGGKNNPALQCVHDIGPLPRGAYTIGRPRTGPTPISLPLQPSPDNNMCGRGDFLIHGDSIADPGAASSGCIILARPARESIASSGVASLLVVDRLA